MSSVLTRISLFFLMIFSFPALGLTQNDTLDIKKTISLLFDGMRNGSSEEVKSAFHPKASMSTVAEHNNKAQLVTNSLEKFAEMVGKEREEIYDERLGEYNLIIDGRLASFAVEYYFFVGDKMSHCGTNLFTLFKESDHVWKIVSITDTRRKTSCNVPEKTW